MRILLLAAIGLLSGCYQTSLIQPRAPAPNSQTDGVTVDASANGSRYLAGSQVNIPVTEAVADRGLSKGKKGKVDGDMTNQPPAILAALLARAELAFRQGKLMYPIHDNAFDRYNAVLLLYPNHPTAIKGLQNIAARYCDLARVAFEKGLHSRATDMLARTKQADKTHQCLNRLADRPLSKPPAIGAASKTRFQLPLKDLSQRNERIRELLISIAQQAKARGMALLIVARNDREARWIYSEMKKGVPGYRLRGNIRQGKMPRIEFERSLIGL